MYNFILICEKLTKEEIRMKYTKGKRGITLIALVITIIILLILSGITISSLAK